MEDFCPTQSELTMLTVHAPAKINLVLEVLDKLNDYHQIASIIQSISLCDILDFKLDEEICFKCDEPSLEHDNIVVEAARLLKETTKYRRGAQIKLRKRIPWGSGLGGGSSDAAVVLLTLNELWKLKLTLSELVHLALKLGSDVPFFIHKGTALIEGKGEKVTPLPSLALTYFILLVPPLPKIPDKTKEMYNKLNSRHFTKGQFIQTALSSLMRGKTIDSSLMFNVFEKVAFDFLPELDAYRKVFEEAGASSIHMAGSGPCLFTSLSEREEANKLYSRLRNQGLECYLVSPFSE